MSRNSSIAIRVLGSNRIESRRQLYEMGCCPAVSGSNKSRFWALLWLLRNDEARIRIEPHQNNPQGQEDRSAKSAHKDARCKKKRKK
jgi:hypothetical protein